MKEVAVITGASSGIGKDLAHIHAEKGGDLVIVARREEALMELKQNL
jgi:short-subunit dehydrogenase